MTRKGQRKDEKGQKDEKRTRDLFLIYICLKELKKTRKDYKHFNK
jgi:hypothetical protein